MNHFLQRVRQTLERHRMIAAGHRLAIAVSGGADSVALLLVLRELAPELGIVLSVAHVNHQLRGAESDADEQFVRALAAQAGMELHGHRADVAAAALREGWNLEDAGRRLRRQFFERLIQEKRADHVAVAHTADDQAETVLAHLLRGSGIAGLAGIHPVAGCVIRPLLETRRAELRAFLEARHQTWREDATNQDTTRLRARIRHHLIPQLEADYQPTLVERLAHLAAIAKDEEAFWSALIEEQLPRLAVRSGNALTVAIADLAGDPAPPAGADRSDRGSLTPIGAFPALARRLIRRLVREVAGDAGQPSAEQVARALDLARRGHGGQRIELPGGVIIERTLDSHLRFRSAASLETSSPAPSYQYDVQWPLSASSAVEVAELGSRFNLKLIDCPASASDTSTAQALLDANLLAPPLVLRSWRVGDAYQPAGRRRVYKLKELLYRAKIDACRRAGWPVLASAGRVVWARGFPPAAECVASAATRAGLLIAEERI